MRKITSGVASVRSKGSVSTAKPKPKYMENKYKNMESMPNISIKSNLLKNDVTGRFIKQGSYVEMEEVGYA